MALGGICLAALFIVVIIGVFSRILNINTAWYEETTRVFFLWMMWVGVGVGFNHSESSRVTVLVNLFPEFLQKVCHALYYILNLVMFAVLIVFGIRLAPLCASPCGSSASAFPPVPFSASSVF